jgi:hypothetical protein
MVFNFLSKMWVRVSLDTCRGTSAAGSFSQPLIFFPVGVAVSISKTS